MPVQGVTRSGIVYGDMIGSMDQDFAPSAPLEFGFRNNVAILAITTHGDIQVRIDNRDGIAKPLLIQIRHDMEVVGLQVVPTSVPNLLPSKNIGAFVKIINEDTVTFNADTPVEEMTAMVEHSKDRIIPIDDQPKEIVEEVRKRNVNYTSDAEVMRYFYHTDLLYNVKNYKLIPSHINYNKEFLRENNHLNQNTKSSAFFDWKINLLNGIDRSGNSISVDLMDILTPNVTALRGANTRDEFSVTTLHDILELLYSRGVKKVIIMDFTCSVIRNKVAGIDQRAERYLSLIQNRNRGGRRTIKKRKRKNTIKNKKTRKNKTIKSLKH
uniref:Uncharacterized protein n=1 Tax=viral metagenome TaxID=1070528 RepID=A0A6C0JEP1_9ZZZZ